jgi:hypothetical protein
MNCFEVLKLPEERLPLAAALIGNDFISSKELSVVYGDLGIKIK